MSATEIPWCVVTKEAAYELGYRHPPITGIRAVSYIHPNEQSARDALKYYGERHIEAQAFPMVNGIRTKVVVETSVNITYSDL